MISPAKDEENFTNPGQKSQGAASTMLLRPEESSQAPVPRCLRPQQFCKGEGIAQRPAEATGRHARDASSQAVGKRQL
jgi:hypothetical protein